MAELSQKEQIAFHEFSVRYRAGLAKKHPLDEKILDTVRGAVREQYEQEKAQERERTPEPEPEKEPDRQPPEPDEDR